MTREEAMTVIMSLNIITTGAPSAWIEATIRIVQAAAVAEREACATVCDEVECGAGMMIEERHTANECARKIRARGNV